MPDQSQGFLQYAMIAMPVGGLLLIFIPFFHKADWILKRSEIKINRIGIELSMDNRTLIVLMGFLLLISSGYVLFQRDQASFQKALRDASDAEKRFNFASDTLRDLTEKTSDLEMNLDFEGVDNLVRERPDFFYKVSLTVRFLPKNGPERTLDQDKLDGGKDGFRIDKGERGIYLTATSIRKDDRLVVDANYRGSKWTGRLTFPKTTLRLGKVLKEENDGIVNQ